MAFTLLSSRSALKSLTWRVVATLTTIVIAWIVTGSLTFAFSIGGIEVIAKFLIYYLHERVWDSVPRVREPVQSTRDALPFQEDER